MMPHLCIFGLYAAIHISCQLLMQRLYINKTLVRIPTHDPQRYAIYSTVVGMKLTGIIHMEVLHTYTSVTG